MFDLPEVLEVAAVVEDEEALFTCVFLAFYKVGTGQFRAKTCSTPDHLPEFCFGPDFLEELNSLVRGCPACFLILKGVVISSHETNRFS